MIIYIEWPELMCFWTFCCQSSPFVSSLPNLLNILFMQILEHECYSSANMHFAEFIWSNLEHKYCNSANMHFALSSEQVSVNVLCWNLSKWNQPAFFASSGPWKGPLSQLVCTDFWAKSNLLERWEDQIQIYQKDWTILIVITFIID